jgi:hypothetical protein
MADAVGAVKKPMTASGKPVFNGNGKDGTISVVRQVGDEFHVFKDGAEAGVFKTKADAIKEAKN